MLENSIRVVGLAIIKNDKNQYLLSRGFDEIKQETFYRPLGGGVEFGEKATVAIARELQEEINVESEVKGLLGIFENIFNYNGKQGHQYMIVHDVELTDRSFFNREEIRVIEDNELVCTAYWKSLEEIKTENAKLYPQGLLEKLTTIVSGSNHGK